MNENALFTRRDIEKAQELEKTIRARHMSPPGSLGLHPALDAAREKYALPDCMFLLQASFQTVLVKQIAPIGLEEAVMKGELIEMPQESRSAAISSCPRGVLVSAGLGALDCLRSNGIELGDIVFFVKYGPPVVRVGRINYEDQVLISLHVAEIRASEEAMQRQKEGRMKVVVNEHQENGIIQRDHVYEVDGEVQAPQGPEDEPVIIE